MDPALYIMVHDQNNPAGLSMEQMGREDVEYLESLEMSRMAS